MVFTVNTQVLFQGLPGQRLARDIVPLVALGPGLLMEDARKSLVVVEVKLSSQGECLGFRSIQSPEEKHYM